MRFESQISELVKILEELLEAHIRLVSSGDVGYWNWENDEEIVNASNLLAKLKSHSEEKEMD